MGCSKSKVPKDKDKEPDFMLMYYEIRIIKKRLSLSLVMVRVKDMLDVKSSDLNHHSSLPEQVIDRRSLLTIEIPKHLKFKGGINISFYCLLPCPVSFPTLLSFINDAVENESTIHDTHLTNKFM